MAAAGLRPVLSPQGVSRMERPGRCSLSEKVRLVAHQPAAVRPASVTPDLLSRIALVGNDHRLKDHSGLAYPFCVARSTVLSLLERFALVV
jgi:hypothetical protein